MTAPKPSSHRGGWQLLLFSFEMLVRFRPAVAALSECGTSSRAGERLVDRSGFFSRIGSFDVFSAACVERIISELIRTYGRGAPATTDWFATAIRYPPRRR